MRGCEVSYECGGWLGIGGDVQEGVLEAVVIKAVELVVDDAHEAADSQVVSCQGFGAMFRLAHGVQKTQNIESELGDFRRVIRLLALGQDRFFQQQGGQAIDDVFLVRPLILVANDDRSERVGQDAGAQDIKHHLHLPERLAGFEHDEDKVPAHHAPVAFDVRVVRLAGAGDEVEDLQALFDVDAWLELDGGFASENLEARDCVDVGGDLGEGDENVGEVWSGT